MFLSLDELKSRPFAVEGVCAFLQRPLYRILDHRKDGRQCNGLILVLSGECRFDFDGETLSAHPYDAVYLPLASRHTLNLSGESPAFYRLDFFLRTVGGEPLYFSRKPLLLSRGISEESLARIRALCEEPEKNRDSLFSTEQIAFLLRSFADRSKSEEVRRLEKAVAALHENFNNVPDIARLAALSHLSTSRFYELFREKYGQTPLAYRDALLFDRAKTLLRGGELTVSEIAALLGFADPAYFSRFFKKHAGISPSLFLKK